jgi:hypothetical protein
VWLEMKIDLASFYRPGSQDEGLRQLQSPATEWTSKSIQAVNLRRGNGEPVVGAGCRYGKEEAWVALGFPLEEVAGGLHGGDGAH